MFCDRVNLWLSLMRRGFRLLFSSSSCYDHVVVERAAQLRFQSQPRPPAHAQPRDVGRKKYILSMFPYPSGTLHMGHVRVYTYGDALARFHRLCGFQVLHPIGWDAFGLPAENAARERRLDPRDWTQSNIAQMRGQLQALGISFDWEREIATCEESYFRWTQWLFVQMHRHGLAYQKEAFVNWDPVDQTVLANEQVDSAGRSWRSGALVEQKMLRQWFLRITDYAPALLEGLDELPGWPIQVKKMQEAWIGRSRGTLVHFGPIRVFTTRPETIMGATFVAVSPNVVSQYPSQVPHPLTGANLPVVAADYVLADYGTAAVMGVPGHDERDRQFADRHNLPVVQVVLDGYLINSGPEFNGLSVEAGARAVEAALIRTGKGESHSAFRLRDWLISRQRPWGAPIPIIHCQAACGAVSVPEHHLPVPLAPRNDDAALDAWSRVACPSCGGPGRRDMDTMDTFVDSSWYFLRFTDPLSAERPCQADRWMAVDTYIGGVEHAVLHLLYARFVNRFLHHLGWSPTLEPFTRLLTQGMVQNKTFRLIDGDRPVPPAEVDAERGIHLPTGGAVKVSWEKMSKSKLNGVDPQAMIAAYGADATRLYVMFRAPPHMALEWDESGIQGMKRWLVRLWELIQPAAGGESSAEPVHDHEKDQILEALHKCVQQVTLDLADRHSFNTAIAALMTLSNVLRKNQEVSTSGNHHLSQSWFVARDALIVMLSPLAPHFACEAWSLMHPQSPDVWSQSWPTISSHKAATDLAAPSSVVSVTVLVDGRKRANVNIDAALLTDPDQKGLVDALHPSVAKWLPARPAQVIVVPAKCLVNLVSSK